FHDSVPSLLRHTDILSLHCTASEETRGMIDTDALAQLPHGAILINTARGDMVDDDAVIAALRSGQLSAAGLDVFKGEPHMDPRYRERGNVLLLPHLGSATLEARTAMGMLALDNLDDFFAHKEPANHLF
ncbi:D-glycerate dehydrogenase, partial [bacterium AH-315-P15]|nr:D-glycerate dehydrogenase [bacterium AH-315-P15]